MPIYACKNVTVKIQLLMKNDDIYQWPIPWTKTLLLQCVNGCQNEENVNAGQKTAITFNLHFNVLNVIIGVSD